MHLSALIFLTSSQSQSQRRQPPKAKSENLLLSRKQQPFPSTSNSLRVCVGNIYFCQFGNWCGWRPRRKIYPRGHNDKTQSTSLKTDERQKSKDRLQKWAKRPKNWEPSREMENKESQRWAKSLHEGFKELSESKTSSKVCTLRNFE